jgi:predicted dehydrogenase
MDRPVTIAVVGTGSRGRIYSGFAERFPDRATVVAAVDPRVDRRDTLADRHAVPTDHRFADWRELADRPRLADAVVLTTPDREHVGPARAFAALGYHVLLEKPMAPTQTDCLAVIEAVERAGVMLGVAHVMRYSRYTDEVKRVVDSGRLGRLVGIEHLEPVGWWHFAHSYVRGNWRRADEAGPSILTKCCHDLDWLYYIVGRPALRVSCTGGLHHFTAERRPPGAGDRCLECSIEPQCPYSAVRLYIGGLRDPNLKRWPISVLTTDVTETGVLRALREGPYGRCVYSCDNDVADQQSATITFEDGVVASFTMSAFTPMSDRRTRIMGTHGFLQGDGNRIAVTDFVTGDVDDIDLANQPAIGASPHAEADMAFMDAFTAAVAAGNPDLIRSGPRQSLESHLMAFAAEESRLSGSPVAVHSS